MNSGSTREGEHNDRESWVESTIGENRQLVTDEPVEFKI